MRDHKLPLTHTQTHTHTTPPLNSLGGRWITGCVRAHCAARRNGMNGMYEHWTARTVCPGWANTHAQLHTHTHTALR